MFTAATVKNLLLDLGGVLYAIDIDSTVEAYSALREAGAPPIDYGKASQHEFFSQLDRGEIEIDEFAEGLRKAYRLDTDLETIKKIWVDLLIGVIPGRIEEVKKLATKYNIALLSNTSKYHHGFYREACEPMFREMDHLFFSFDMSLRKPDPAIYQEALRQMNWEAGETLFVDDSKVNIVTADAEGIQTYWMETHDHWAAMSEALMPGE